MTYAVLSDIHAHAWSVFSHTNSAGENSRLRLILDDMKRAASTLISRGGDTMVIAGDIFHERGKIDPEVLNPTQAMIREILDMGIFIYAIPGNHDLKSNDTRKLSSAIQTLAETTGGTGEFTFRVANEPTFHDIGDGKLIAMAPWRDRNENLLADIERLAKQCSSAELAAMDLFIHAGIEGVLPSRHEGITAKQLGAFGFRHVFAGHYHNHKILDHGVVSIGATAHHTWGDIGTKAGFLLVEDDGTVNFMRSHAPAFIDVGGMTEQEMELSCPGNYVRFRGPPMSQSDITELRDQFTKWGAAGVSLEVPRVATTVRSAVVSTTGKSLDASVVDYVDADKAIPAHVDRAAVRRRAQEVLDETRLVYDAA